MKHAIFALILMVGIVGHARAEERFSAAHLAALCFNKAGENPATIDEAQKLCSTYMLGLTDALYIMQLLARQSTKTCMPEAAAIEIKEAQRVFQSWLANNPHTAGNSAGLVAGLAIVSAYRCSR